MKCLTCILTMSFMFCLLSFTTYKTYRLPEDDTGRRRPLVCGGLLGMVFFGGSLVFGLMKEFS